MPQHKIHKVMSEFKRGTLKTSSGRPVTSREQAIAIALSEARRAGELPQLKKSKRKRIIGRRKKIK